LPLFAVRDIHIDATYAGLTLVLTGLLGMLGRICWGRAMDSVTRADVVLTVLAALSLIATTTLVVASLLESVPFLICGLILHGVGAISANAVIVHVLVSSLGSEDLAKASGLQALAQYAGFAMGPLAFGSML